MSVRDYKDLLIWQRSFAIANNIIPLTAMFPKEHRYGLASQINRCAVSVPSNIAEGYARHSTKEYIRFLRIALGSLAELETQCMITVEQSFISQDTAKIALKEIDEIAKMTHSIIRKLQPN